MSPGGSTRFDFLTGKVLSTLGPRVNCTRATGSIDSIFVRGGRDGTIRYDLADNKQQHLCPMRPSCQDGVIASYGHLYWGPWMCDCNLTLVGVVSLEPAGSFDFNARVNEKERLEVSVAHPGRVAELTPDDADWPTLRANNKRSAYLPLTLADKVALKWTFKPKGALPPTAPVAAGGLIFTGGADGVVRALDPATGEVRWSVRTGGAITYPPSVWKGRLYAGSGDGWVYCLEAKTGRQLWRFRAAPIERTIPVYGTLRSTWPVASGVLVEDGVVYAAAGMANHDGTHVYALDAITGKLRWHNGTSGSLHPVTAGGVSVNGHLLLHNKKLHLAGGNVVAVASYDVKDGKCLTDPQSPMSHTQFRAGSDLFVEGKQVMVSGSPLYSSQGDYRMVSQAVLDTPAGKVLAMLGPHNSTVGLVEAGANPGAKARWTQKAVSRIQGLAVTKNALVIAGTHDPVKKTDRTSYTVLALSLKDGSVLWQEALPATPASWGLALDRDGRVIVSLEDGRVLCYAPKAGD
jgi:outer membrane protein assembly factor BamB